MDFGRQTGMLQITYDWITVAAEQLRAGTDAALDFLRVSWARGASWSGGWKGDRSTWGTSPPAGPLHSLSSGHRKVGAFTDGGLESRLVRQEIREDGTSTRS